MTASEGAPTSSVLPVHTTGASLAGDGGVAILRDAEDTVVDSPVADWALGMLRTALLAHGATVREIESLDEARREDFVIVATGFDSTFAQTLLQTENITAAAEAEALVLADGTMQGRGVLLAAGADPRGLGYALTELADRVDCHGANREALEFPRPVFERPASRVRSIMRGFNSEEEDKTWFYDLDYWRAYLDLLATSRINRLNFTTGMGYNFAVGIIDGYFLFPFPFLFTVPGYDVRVKGLSPSERDRNLATIRFVGEECARRAIDFQFGIWTLAHEWARSPRATHRIEGLTEEMHPAYCRDALALLLDEVPTITGVTFRVHEESGIPRGRENFWETLFGGIARCGRRIEIDMHSKSMSPETLELALATGQRVVISPKYGGEQQPLPYHQASIRRRERAGPGAVKDAGSGVLEGDRGFTRYGYADSLAENRSWEVIYRIWPGTQRFLLSGDPVLCAGYGRHAAFCDAGGIELSEPLYFKGRRGSGLPGGRLAYADASLEPARDFEKYAGFYRLWGRFGYNPDTDPEVGRRHLRREFGAAAEAVEAALAPVSRVLPLITTAHLPSASCVRYWPEIYTDVPIAESIRSAINFDTLSPKVFGNISPLDPQLFQSPDECAEALLYGPVTGKYTPLEVARWLEGQAGASEGALERARAGLGEGVRAPAFRRIEEDVRILIGIARFFSGKLQAAVLWRVHMNSGNREAGARAIALYEEARDAWAAMAERAAGVYRESITYGSGAATSGHWVDRIPAFDADLAEMRRLFERTAYPSDDLHGDPSARVMQSITSGIVRPSLRVEHEPAAEFEPNREHPITVRVERPGVERVFVHYRAVNHADGWERIELSRRDGAFHGTISTHVTARRFPLQYYFEIFPDQVTATLFPGLRDDLTNTPYFVVRRAGEERRFPDS